MDYISVALRFFQRGLWRSESTKYIWVIELPISVDIIALPSNVVHGSTY